MASTIYYEPHTWNDQQAALHQPATLEEAMHAASCLAGGWYRRPVTIWMHVTDTNNEAYVLAPADYPMGDPWRRCYTIDAHVEDARG